MLRMLSLSAAILLAMAALVLGQVPSAFLSLAIFPSFWRDIGFNISPLRIFTAAAPEVPAGLPLTFAVTTGVCTLAPTDLANTALSGVITFTRESSTLVRFIILF
jgi:hypothetical protein